MPVAPVQYLLAVLNATTRPVCRLIVAVLFTQVHEAFVPIGALSKHPGTCAAAGWGWIREEV